MIPQYLEALDLHQKWLNKTNGGKRLQIKQADLCGFVMPGMHLRGASMPGAKFDYAQLDDADFTEADLFASSFTESSLMNCNFSRANLRGANFRRSNLSMAKLTGADMRGGLLMTNNSKVAGADSQAMMRTNFRGANLAGADLSRAQISHAEFTHADLSCVDFTGANLESAVMNEAILDGADFTDCSIKDLVASSDSMNLIEMMKSNGHLAEEVRNIVSRHRLWNYSNGQHGRRGDLRDSELTKSKFDNWDLSALSFNGCDLSGSSFRNSRLQFVDFTGSNLTGCDFTGADLRGAAFRHSSLCKSDLTNADLSPADILDAHGQKTGRTWACIFLDVHIQEVITNNTKKEGIRYLGSGSHLSLLYALVALTQGLLA